MIEREKKMQAWKKSEAKQKQIKQAEEQIRQNKHNKDPSVLEGVKEWYNKMTTQLQEAKDKFQKQEG